MLKSSHAVIFLLLLLLVISPAQADEPVKSESEESRFAFEGKASFLSDYVFRGMNVYPDTSIQPFIRGAYSLDSHQGISGSVWAHFSAGGADRHDQNFTEFDYTVSYDLSFDWLKASAGHVWYLFPYDNTGALPATKEIFATTTLALPLSPTFTFYSDYDEFDYQTYELSFAHTFGEPGSFNCTPWIVFGFAGNSEKVYERDGLEHITVGLSADADLGIITAIPMLNYTFKIDENTNNQFWLGVSFKF